MLEEAELIESQLKFSVMGDDENTTEAADELKCEKSWESIIESDAFNTNENNSKVNDD